MELNRVVLYHAIDPRVKLAPELFKVLLILVDHDDLQDRRYWVRELLIRI